MNRVFCDTCDKPLSEVGKVIVINDMMFFELPHQPRGFRNLHFCDVDCMRGWMVKTANKPNIISLNPN